MADLSDPKAPFVFHDDEPYLGEGAFLRSPRRRLLTVVLVGLLVLGAVALVQVPRMLAARQLDPAVNSATGLPDGSYVLEVDASMHQGDRCWFRGPIRGLPAAGEVTVAGSGTVQCARAGDYIGRVRVTVVDGRATITAVGY